MAKRGAATKRRTPAANIDDDMPCVRNENGELVPYYGTQCIYYESGELVPADAPPVPRKFTAEDGARAHRNRDRYTRASWGKKIAGHRRSRNRDQGAVAGSPCLWTVPRLEPTPVPEIVSEIPLPTGSDQT